LGNSDLFSETCVFAHQFLDSDLVAVELLTVDSEPVFVLVELRSQLGGLGGGQSHVLLCLLHLSSQGSDFAVPLLDQRIQSLALLSEDGDLVLVFGSQSLEGAVGLLPSLFDFVVLVADHFELVLNFADLPGRKSEVLLSRAHLLSEGAVLAHQFLHALAVVLGVSVVGVDAALVVIELGVELAHLVGRQSQVLLGPSHLLVEVGVLLEQVVDLLLEDVVLLVVAGNAAFVLVEFLDDLAVLIGRQSQVLLGAADLAVHGSVLADQLGDLLLQSADGLVHALDLTQFALQVAEVAVLAFQHTVQSLDLLG